MTTVLNEGDRNLVLTFRADGGVDFGPEDDIHPIGYYELWVASNLLKMKADMMWLQGEQMRQVKNRALATDLVRATSIPEMGDISPATGRRQLGKIKIDS